MTSSLPANVLDAVKGFLDHPSTSPGDRQAHLNFLGANPIREPAGSYIHDLDRRLELLGEIKAAIETRIGAENSQKMWTAALWATLLVIPLSRLEYWCNEAQGSGSCDAALHHGSNYLPHLLKLCKLSLYLQLFYLLLIFNSPL